ncbi:MAG: M55 family metallopeptidase [Clostridia bacterium]
MNPKKLFISADIEGTCGIAAWQETTIGNPYSEYFLTQMSKEVAAAAQGALDVGYSDVVVKDAHDTARNIYPNLLPKQAKILRNWTQNPYCMVAGLDVSFDAAIFTGYHSSGNSAGNPLAHTMTTDVFSIKFNGKLMSEFMLNAYTAAYLGVPVVMVTGDEYLCETARELVPKITTVAVSKGIGGGSLSIHPEAAIEKIREGAKIALSRNPAECKITLPTSFSIQVVYKRQEEAYRCSFFPGGNLFDANTVVFSTDNYKDMLAFCHFCL